ncbi:Deoxycytidine monophosphate (dCMP) deaminase [Saccharomyces cerevisiae]|uniref:Deoxycytidylate deaminase n=5 Tax=Saccharomyces cerevisiae TaxID=4932 RepID=DCTD_YEAST|nr:deoxycytidine monophosphate deaminase [Saccharomyces cerevisiae S288C]P06773.2 RecName: Full=Deoxycytidylate deaminase; AltName: Full=dCMP deaminase [Saccharomyces cerevisiae S288C]AAB68985.1 Dcd1p: dCMP deaminase [Saccharomyces cerevisiae]AJU17985.1 Dcd1p [Saccharomyces cerevisiae YJM1388]AJU20495.1 Dcd1p [Saccharomyces cerevisiae YJM1433]AJU22231.1 Dcd1p [Saccharomyces cerevisiae YJM1460]AJU24370.1 Dcd1p [Saccharomyces cerevisiae YJM1549]AJU25547.1 Dcd1p [Saccharomyces cerevisiae YJM161|eukprot:NP_012014.1 deoxycytidine monophosphate deaminase [Saccharomyces cerevisiae S288C]
MLIGVSGTKFCGCEDVINMLVDHFHFELLNHLDNPEEILDYATKNYTKNSVIFLEKLSLLEKLEKRPFFVHLSIDAPVTTRVALYRKTTQAESLSLEQIIQAIDQHDFQPEGIKLREKSHLRFKIVNEDRRGRRQSLINNITTQLKILDDKEKQMAPLMRPSWDSYFMKLATLAASRSNCMKRRVGCVIVRECRVIATGYNGTPRHLTNCFNGGCPRCNDGDSRNLHTCLCLHAEENALLEAGRDRVGQNATLYCDTCPCLTCSVKIVQTGISEVVYSQSYRMDEESFKVLKNAGITVRQFSFTEEPRIVMI